MRPSPFSLLLVSLSLLPACTVHTIASPTDSGTVNPQDAALSPDSGADASVIDAGDKTTWNYIYATYFGPGSVGHCGNSGCHAVLKANFACGSQAACYESLVTRQLIGVEASVQPLVDPQATPLAWFANGNGSMPQDKPVANATAANEITAWAAAGAKL